MTAGATVEGLEKVKAAIRLKSVAVRSGGILKLVVGYTAPYALYVHENLEVHHPIGKAKFLTGPERRLKKQLGQIVKTAMKKGKTPRAALWEAGKVLVAASQKEVPVDTGALKQSVYIAVVGG